MSDSLSSEFAVQRAELISQVSAISMPDVVYAGDQSVADSLVAKIKANIISEFTKWLARNSDLLPPKADVLKFLEEAIDRVILAIDPPWWAKLVTPFVKRAILDVAEKLYDSILNPAPQV